MSCDEPAPTAAPGRAGAAPHARPGSHGLRLGARALIASLSLLVIIGSGLAWATYKTFTAGVPHGDPVPALSVGETDPDGSSQNILLIGSDTRAGATHAELKAMHTGYDTTTANADTMMVLHIPTDGAKPTVISFPRDSWVQIPGYGVGKINSAYPDAYNAAKSAGHSELAAQSAGIIETIKAIHQLTGLHIDHYMQVDLLGFYRISEAIGGVSVCLNSAQNASTDRDAYGKGYSGIDLPKGVSVISGGQALAFVRQRHGLPNGDLDRIKRQQYFLKAAFAKITSGGVLLNPFKLHSMLTAVGSSLLIDPTLDLISLARQFESLASGAITFETIPNNGPQLIYPDGVETSIVAVDKAAIPAFLQQLEGRGDAAYASAKPASPAAVTVDVLNGTTTARLAARNADLLRALGFHVNTVDSTPATQVATMVEYPPGKAGQAKAVLREVPGAKPVQTADVARVTLILGTDGRAVRSATPAGRASATAVAGASSTARTAPNAAAGIGCIN